MYSEPVTAVSIQVLSLDDDGCVLVIQLDNGKMLNVEYADPLNLLHQTETVLHCQEITRDLEGATMARIIELHPQG